ncbi:CBL-interacting protein kinase 1-like [Iris pallida]|uniref:CBL-interacting protein kinase 1-like n=1 Tax=Iris pallida TaxID=29817 RepID=A0AAX6H9R4_IRIPA|nr:CBL-interacting protein kinase 1-like [Iris pallida]
MGFHVQKGHGKLKVMQQNRGSSCPKSPGSLSVAAEIFGMAEKEMEYRVELFNKTLGSKTTEMVHTIWLHSSMDLQSYLILQIMKPKNT